MSTRRSLSTAISTHTKFDPVLYRLVLLIPLMGVASRKILLGICQDQQSPEEARSVSLKVAEILSDLNIRQHEGIPSLHDLREMANHIASRPIYRSFVSMMLRNEALDHLSGAEEVIREGFLKEFGAGQNRREEEQRLSYQVLDQDNFAPSSYSIFYPIAPGFARYAQNLTNRFSTRLGRLGIIFPQVQRRKNMSRETCRNLYESGYTGKDKWEDFTTLDLELHKMQTGEMVQGNSEMRMAWKFNELKPRFYYCSGGSDYWESRYMKKIAVELMESIESTTLGRRQNPTDIQYSLKDEDYLAIWDMSAFTSSLSELKHFLFYLVKNLEEDSFIQTHPLQVLSSWVSNISNADHLEGT